MQITSPYEITILGKVARVLGWDADGFLLLADGTRIRVCALDRKIDLTGQRIVELASMRLVSPDWTINGPEPLRDWLRQFEGKFDRLKLRDGVSEPPSSFLRYWILDGKLRCDEFGDHSQIEQITRGVAWVQGSDEVETDANPILLAVFTDVAAHDDVAQQGPEGLSVQEAARELSKPGKVCKPETVMNYCKLLKIDPKQITRADLAILQDFRSKRGHRSHLKAENRTRHRHPPKGNSK